MLKQELAEELQLLQKFVKRKVNQSFKNNIWRVGLADMQ